MHRNGKTLSRIFPFLLLGLLVVLLPTIVSASQSAVSPVPTPVTPEPYPNSDVYPAVVYLATQADLQLLYQLNIDFEDLKAADGTRPLIRMSFEPSIATIYINPDQARVLSAAGLSSAPIPNEGYRSFLANGPGSGQPGDWPTFDDYVARMQALEDAHPSIVSLVSIGKSVQNRDLWCIEVTDNPGLDELEPEFKYTANHHGDETTGIEMTMRFAELLADNYGTDPLLTDLVDKMEIWLCPIYNPDGYMSGSRYNAHGADLNRDFPDRFTDPVDDPFGREPETQAFMNFGYAHRFVMGANFHGGEQVLNYPWDAVDGPPFYAPDDQLFYEYGVGYTSRNPDLWNNPYFDDGITRGWEWYMIYGGMQDWAYYYHCEHHVTLEISWDKNPPFNQMDGFWDRNREAMLWWLERAWTGLGGTVLDARDNSPLDATVTLVGRGTPNEIVTDPAVGDYHRVISDGLYTLNAASDGYQSQEVNATVVSGTLTTVNFYLCPSDPWVVSGTVTDASTGLPLQAMLEFLGSSQVVNSDPVTGGYSVEVCPSEYTMRVSAPYHFPEERAVNIDHSQVQDFNLVPTPDFSSSNKEASSNQPLPQDIVQYQLHVINTGPTASVSVTDTLPISLTWTGELSSTQGIPIFEDGQIMWQGEVYPAQPVTITYSASLNECLPAGATILNLAEFDDGINWIITSKVELEVTNAAPSIPASPSPADGAMLQPVNLTLSWAASADLNCDALTYDLALGTSPTPSPVAIGLTTSTYTPGELLPGTIYYWFVIAKDGLTQTTGPTWRFTTSSNGLLTRIFLPLAIR